MQNGALIPGVARRAWARLGPWLASARLGPWLAASAMLLSSSALVLGFHLDDFIGRYVYSDLPGAARLYQNYSGGYGLALGDPAENHWQMEAGWAPWWTYEQLRIALFRPLGVISHAIDFALWPDAAVPMHVHSLLWLAALVLAVTFMYRSVLGTVVGGAAALLFALDHTHGFAVGHICNRHALMGPTFGALCLAFHVRGRTRGAPRDVGVATLFYVLGLLTSESSIAVAGYLVTYELFAGEGGAKRRALSAAPAVIITLAWRALYNAAGYGAFGSGVYTDMGREPLQFARAFLERAPVLWMGQFFTPPAETGGMLGEAFARGLLGWALVIMVLSVWALYPLLRADRLARFFCAGALGSLVPAAAVEPNNRQLVFVSLGAMGLLAQLFQRYAGQHHPRRGRLRVARVGEAFGMLLLFTHLVLSPLSLPFTTASVALTEPMHTGAASVGDAFAGRDLIFVTAPDFYTVRMVQLMKRLDGRPLPRSFRSIGGVPAEVPEPMTLARRDARTLDVHFHAGLMHAPGSDLYRDRSLPMPAGSEVNLRGFHVRVLDTTPDGRPLNVRFTFAHALESPELAFVRWEGRRFVPFAPPREGEAVTLEGARMPADFH